MNLNQIEATIKQYLIQKGVEKFWADSAISNIRMGLQGNKHFVKEITAPKLRIDRKNNLVTRFECNVVAELPDQGRTANGNLVYTFNKKTHKVRIHTQ